MKSVSSVAVALSLLAFANTAAMSQEVARSEEEIRCFVQGKCKVDGEKAWSLSSVPSKQAAAQTATTALVKPRTTTRSTVTQSAVGYTAPSKSLVGEGTREAMDMALSFEFNSDQLTAAAKAQSDIFARVLKEESGVSTFLIEGHTDSVGSRAYNMALSRRRAQSVVNYLVDQGVPRSKLRAVGYGFDHPRAKEAGDPANRRVEIVKN